MKKIGKPQSNSDVVNKEPRVLLIGYGWVGQYMGSYFEKADIFTSGGWLKQKHDHYDLAIIGVPTPMHKETGRCKTNIIDQVIKQHKHHVDHFLIKSTVEIGTTDRIAKEYGVSIAMSPEYVGETLGHPLLEPRRDAFQIIGGKKKTANAIAEFFYTVLHASAPIYICTALEAEIIKYTENMWIMQRVDFWNDVYDVADAFGASFNSIREGLVLDPRMNRTHSFVYKHNRGWSGKCLPKDMNALAYSMREAGHPLPRLEESIKQNVERRKDIDSTEQLMPKGKTDWTPKTPKPGFSGNRGSE